MTELRHRLKPTMFLPVHNQAVSISFAAEDFPASRGWNAVQFASLASRRWCAV